MSKAVLVIGDSGAGKSTSMRNLNPEKTLVIQTLAKPLPFKSVNWKTWDRESNTGAVYVADRSDLIVKVMQSAIKYGKTIIVIDDFQYLMANEFMREANTKGFDKFTNIAVHAWEVVKAALDMPDNVRVYFLSHSETTDTGRIKAKTIGKLIDEKIVLEGMFSVVLRAGVSEGRHYFATRNTGADTVKTPMGLFEDKIIDNDLSYVDEQLCDYYGLSDIEAKKNVFDMQSILNSLKSFGTLNELEGFYRELPKEVKKDELILDICRTRKLELTQGAQAQ